MPTWWTRATNTPRAQVRNAALQSGILAETQRNAEQILVPMLRTLTGRRVVLGQQLTMPKVGPKQ